MLWAVGNLHLLGSVHILDEARSVLYPAADRAYRAAGRVTFEHDLSTAPNMSLLENPPGQLLSQQVPTTVFSNAVNQWAKLGLPAARLEQMRPWFAAMAIVVNRAIKRGYQEAYGVDKPLWERAAQDGKTRETLESADAPFVALGSGPIAEQTLWLDYATKPNNVADDDFEELMDAWYRRDDVTIGRMLADRLAIMPVAFGNAVVGRNQKWMPTIMNQVVETIPTLVIVGALHCVGDEGIPALLRKAGQNPVRIS